MKKEYHFAATIGLDWANQKHDLWLRPADGAPTEHIILEQKPEALHAWITRLRQRFGGQPVAICLETSRGPVISALQGYEFIVLFPINPKALKNYRAAFCVSGAKDDRTDAMLLEEYVRLHPDKLRALAPDTVLTRKLAGLVELRRELVHERTRLVEQCHCVLKTYYPLAEQLLADQLTSVMAADFLACWPDLASLQKADGQRLRKFFYAHNSRSGPKMEERLEQIAQALALTTDEAVLLVGRTRVLAIVAQLKPLHRSIARLDQTIQTLLDQHPDADIFRSLPGAGPCLAPRLLVAFGTDRDRFQSAAEVAQFYGIAPVVRQSGATKTVHFRTRCPKFGRQSFHENAGCALRDKTQSWARLFYENYKEEHEDRHHQAVRSVAFKYIRIYYACWKNRTPYDPDRYLKALEKNGSPWAKPLNPAKP